MSLWTRLLGQNDIANGVLRSWDDAHVWSGVYRRSGVATVAIVLRLRYWSLPLSISGTCHIISVPGVTVGVGPLYLSWGLV